MVPVSAGLRGLIHRREPLSETVPAVTAEANERGSPSCSKQQSRPVSLPPTSRSPARLLDQRLLDLRLELRDPPLEITIRPAGRCRDGHNRLAIRMTLVWVSPC